VQTCLAVEVGKAGFGTGLVRCLLLPPGAVGRSLARVQAGLVQPCRTPDAGQATAAAEEDREKAAGRLQQATFCEGTLSCF